MVDVPGGVARPGVYELKQGSRVIDAIKVAGGLCERRCLERSTGPRCSPTASRSWFRWRSQLPPARPEPGPGGPVAAAAGLPDAPISLGTATPEQLEEIEGIGPVTAAKIIEFRDTQGVGSIDDLDQVSGIGPVTMEALRSGLQP